MNYNQSNDFWLFKEPKLYASHTYSSDKINTDMVTTKEKQLTSADLHSPVFVHKSSAAKTNNAQWALYQDQQNSVEPLSPPKKPFICDLSRGYDDYKNGFSSVVSAKDQTTMHYYDSRTNPKTLFHGSVNDYHSNDMYNKKQPQPRQQDYYCSINSRSSSNHFNTESLSVTISMDQLNDSMHDMRIAGQTPSILQRNTNKQVLDTPRIDQQSREERVYSSADLNDSTTTTVSSTTGEYTQHQFFCSTQVSNYKSENITSNPKWSHVVAENRPNKSNANYNELTLFKSIKDGVHGYQNTKHAIGTSCATSATAATSVVEHPPMMYKVVHGNNSDKDPNVRPIRRHSSPHIKWNSSGDDTNVNSYNSSHNNGIKRLSDSIAFQTGLVGNDTSPSSKGLPVAKITNMPWQVQTEEIEQFFSHSLQDANYQYVHLLINKSTGKTQKEAFIEFDSEEDLAMAMKKLKSRPMFKGRQVNAIKSSSEELFRNVFPNWKGEFIDGVPSISIDNNDDHCDSRSVEKSKEQRQESSNTSIVPPPPLLIQRHEYDSLLNTCRNYKSSYSRKCPSRPFENFISIMVKFPWHAPQIITTMQRDHLYEYYKLATGSLRYHLDKPCPRINSELIVRMIRVALVCPGFTINQKKEILKTSTIHCPDDLTHFLIEPPKEDDCPLDQGEKNVV